MTEVAEIIELPEPETALTVYQQPNGLDPYIERIRAEVAGHVPDLTTRKGREHIASLAFKVRKSKTALDGLGKQLVDDLKEIPKKIDAERKRMRDQLDALAEEVRRPLTEWEEAEADRVSKHQTVIAGIVAAGQSLGELTTQMIKAEISGVESLTIDHSWEEFEAEAHRAKAATLEALRKALAAREKYETEQAELARLRAEAEARAKRDEQERIAREAAERATREAEAKAKAEREAAARREAEAKAAAEQRELQLRLAAEKAERERLEAIARAEQEKRDAEARQAAAIEAERKRVADEKAREEAEAKRRESDRAHKAKVNRAALEAFVAKGLPEDCAKQAVTMIAKGEIPGVRIIY